MLSKSGQFPKTSSGLGKWSKLKDTDPSFTFLFASVNMWGRILAENLWGERERDPFLCQAEMKPIKLSHGSLISTYSQEGVGDADQPFASTLAPLGITNKHIWFHPSWGKLCPVISVGAALCFALKGESRQELFHLCNRGRERENSTCSKTGGPLRKPLRRI